MAHATPWPSTGRCVRAARWATEHAGLVVSGPGVVEALERLYPCHVADIKPGRSRYALLLNERGHVMDDGMILRESETRFVLTFTSGGAANAEMWIRDWIETWGLRVHVLDRTMSLAAINVTGPLAGELLARAGLTDQPRFLGHAHADVAGVPSRQRLVHRRGCLRAAPPSPPVGRAVAGIDGPGTDLGIRPHGLQAPSASGLRRATSSWVMGHRVDTTPRRLDMDWAVRMEKPRFIGRAAPGAGRQAARPAAPLRLHDARRSSDRGQPHLRRRRGRRPRLRQLGVASPRACGHARLAEAGPLRRSCRDRRAGGDRRPDALLRPGGPPCPSLRRCTPCAS